MDETGPLKSLVKIFKEVPDPRRGNAIRHRLDEVLALAVLAAICECTRFTEMEMFAEENEGWLKEAGLMELPGGAPSHDTFGDVLAAIDPDALEGAFIEWAQSLRKHDKSDIIAIDGKVARGSRNAGGRGDNIVSAYACGARLVLGQMATDEKSNEITAIPALIERLRLKGSLVTIDAMGTQKDIAAKIKKKKADYVLPVKGNQPTLLEDMELYFKDPPQGVELDFAQTIDKSHGRIEVRTCRCCHDVGWLVATHSGWEGLKGIGMITSERTIVSTKTKEQAVHYLIFSRPTMTAAELLDAKRAHWGVENGLHWVLDMDFREDEGRMRIKNATENMAAIRRIAINLLRAEDSKPKLSINLKRKKCLFSRDYLLKVLGVA
jgi:predicted transposase YbfD/YdcC